ncbi:MAG: hypothetical protein KC917_15955, partial [Candidatus Omnitrophica bacterium]|nr:hypothetical protein [Candidatus Omnitrophota bacterium]
MAEPQLSRVYAPGPYLFLDDHWIAEQSHLERVIQTPERLPEPLINGVEDENYQPYVSVARTGGDPPFRMWYNTFEKRDVSHLATITSRDGIHWDRPHRILEDPTRIDIGASVIDEGPEFAVPAQRFKFAFHGHHDGERGLQIAVSPDGLDYSLIAPGIVLPHNHDICTIYRDPTRDQYGAFVSMMVEDSEWEERRRMTFQSVSPDLVNWREPWRVTGQLPNETGNVQFYGMGGVLARGELLIALTKVLRDDLNAEPGADDESMGDTEREAAGLGYTVLAWSHDGETWRRDDQPFFDRNRNPGTWDRAHAWVDCQLPVDDEVFLYYGGYARGHKVGRHTERQIGLARLKRDRYVARVAHYADATLRTPIGKLAASRLTVNASIDGDFRARVLDVNGELYAGFDWDDCEPVTEGDIAIDVNWGKPLEILEGKPVAFEFR